MKLTFTTRQNRCSVSIEEVEILFLKERKEIFVAACAAIEEEGSCFKLFSHYHYPDL